MSRITKKKNCWEELINIEMFCVHNQCVELRVIKHLISAQYKISAISWFISTVAQIIKKQSRSRSLSHHCYFSYCTVALITGMWYKLHAQMVTQPNGACNEHYWCILFQWTRAMLLHMLMNNKTVCIFATALTTTSVSHVILYLKVQYVRFVLLA